MGRGIPGQGLLRILQIQKSPFSSFCAYPNPGLSMSAAVCNLQLLGAPSECTGYSSDDTPLRTPPSTPWPQSPQGCPCRPIRALGPSLALCQLRSHDTLVYFGYPLNTLPCKLLGARDFPTWSNSVSSMPDEEEMLNEKNYVKEMVSEPLWGCYNPE